MSLTESSTDGMVAWSRSTGLPSSLGKATAELKCKVPEPVKMRFALLAHSFGFTESELLRHLVMVRLDGLEHTERMHAEQLRMAAGVGPERATNEVTG